MNQTTDSEGGGQAAEFPTGLGRFDASVVGPRPLQTRVDTTRAVAQLRRADVRVTQTRGMILQFFIDMQRGHYSAEDVRREVGRRSRGVHLSSVYRVLTLLCGARLLSSVMLDSTRVVYELNDGASHDHLVCDDCGRVYDFNDPTLDARREAIAHERRFRVERYQLVMHGVCHACQQDNLIREQAQQRPPTA